MESSSVASVAATATRKSSPPAAAEDIAALVSIRQAFDVLDIRIRGSKRADCPLCEGGSIGTMSCTDKLWHCFRCGRGGDVFTLVEQVRNCSFREALNFVASIAGVELANSTEVRRELAEAKKKAQRVKTATKKLQSLERDLLLTTREEVLSLHKLRRDAGARLAALRRGAKPRFLGESELAWSALALVAGQELRAVATYTFLAFASPADQAHFALNPRERERMVDAVLTTGAVVDEKGRVMEVGA